MCIIPRIISSGSRRMNGAFEISTICGWPFSFKTNSPGSGNGLSVSLGRGSEILRPSCLICSIERSYATGSSRPTSLAKFSAFSAVSPEINTTSVSNSSNLSFKASIFAV